LVRAALQPDADAESKERAQLLLRELLSLVGAQSATAMPAATSIGSERLVGNDPLSAILERIWPLLATETARAAASAVPFIPFGRLK
jgi:hypothetical protein